MPCRYDPTPEELAESARNLAEAQKKQKDELDLVTRLLCKLTKEVPSPYLKDPELVKWMESHKIMDARREAFEKKTKDFLAKMGNKKKGK